MRQAIVGHPKYIKKLYVIGNGFDLYHELDTSYLSFGIFLKNSYPLIYEYITQYHGISDITNGIESSGGYLWSEFEFALADLDYETILEDYSEYLASPGSEDFRDRDWGAFQIEIEKVIDEITIKLFAAFHEFILGVKYPNYVDNKRLALEKDGMYLNFNYTDTLEKIYNISNTNIRYIHNQASVDSELILGHGIDPKNFEIETTKPPENMSSEESERWMEMMSDKFDYSFNLGQNQIMTYFSLSHKNTECIINENKDFFQHLKNVNEIFVLGHSLSEIDKPYFNKIFDSVYDDSIWRVTYHFDEEKLSNEKMLSSIGIKNNLIDHIKMNDLSLSKNNG
ncbi:MAG: bacteriophage abortive infection AbiH family protein [Chlorobium sp.]|nr:MAG: hypothetical protein FDX17_01155 [Chlorobium sp.]